MMLTFIIVGCTQSEPMSEPDNEKDNELPESGKTETYGAYTLETSGTELTNIIYTSYGAAVKVTIPEGITKIKGSATATLLRAVSVTLPSTLTEIEAPISSSPISRIIEIYDLSPHVDLRVSSKKVHTSAEEASVLTEKDGFMFYAPDNAAPLLVGFTEYTDTLTIPCEYEGKPCDIATSAFSYTTFKKVIFSEGITTIPANCFYNSTIGEIELPSTITTITARAFAYCTISGNVELPSGIKHFGTEAFRFATVGRISVPDTLPKGSEFLHRASIDILYLPSTSTIIVSDLNNYINVRVAFEVHPDHPEYYTADGVLFDKSGETLLRYPSHKPDTEYTVPNSVKTIHQYAFSNIEYLKKLIIGHGTEKIEYQAISICYLLETVIIPETVTSIDSETFYYSLSLKDISVHENNTAYTSIDGVLFNKDVTELICYPASKHEWSYTVPSTVTKIAPYAFYSNVDLRKVILPEGLLSIGSCAFYNSDTVKIQLSINFPSSLEYIGRCVFDNRYLILTWEYTGEWLATDISDNTEVLGEEHFNNMKELLRNYLLNSDIEKLEKLKTEA